MEPRISTLHPQPRVVHQPTREQPQYQQPSTHELASAFGNSVALVLALNAGTAPLKVEFLDVERESVTCQELDAAGKPVPTPRPLQRYEGEPMVVTAVKLALQAQFKAIAVLATPQEGVAGAIESLLEEAGLAESCAVISYNAEEDRRQSLAAGGFDLYDLTAEQLHQARKLMQDNDADNVMLLGCDQVQLTPAHLMCLAKELYEHPESEFTASWIAWIRRTPYLLPAKLFDKLQDSPATKPGQKPGMRPLPCIDSCDVVFGEEKLAANGAGNSRMTTFFKQNTLSALEAVRLAHALQCEGEPLEQTRSSYDVLSPASKMLVNNAAEITASATSALSSQELEAARKASVWARRNQEDFPILNDRAHKGKLAYMDSAATSQRCERMLQAQADYDAHENANIYRGAYDLSMQATSSMNDARAALERFINADRRTTVFTANASASCNIVAQAWGETNIAEGDLIVIGLAEHHSNLVPWVMLAQRKNARIAYLPIDQNGRYDQEAYAQLLQERPKIVCFAHIGNVLGMLNPAKKMAAQAHAVGARVMLDATQSIPHVKLDVKDLDCDFIAFSAHKMYGPTGIGGLWISPQAFQEMEPAWCGGGAISHVSPTSYYLREQAIQYEVGTPPISQAISWGAAIEYLGQLGMDAVEEHSRALTRYAVAALQGIEGITIFGDHNAPDGQTGLLSVRLPGVACLDLGIVCGKLGVAIRSGGHCALPLAASLGVTGTARASFGVHTTIEDVEAFALGVEVTRRLCSPWHDEQMSAVLNEGKHA